VLRHNRAMHDTSALLCCPLKPGHHVAAQWVLMVACWLAAAGAAHAQDIKPVYRCPGPPVLYTDGISAQDARDKGCRTIEGAPITIMQAPARPKPAAAASGNGSAAGSGAGTSPGASSRPGDGKIDATAQRARDTDRQRILGDELKTEEERLAALKKELNNGEPERRGDERNFQKYADRVAEMKAAVARKEADVAALKRELAKLPQ
jgi:hypothetical protein